MLTVAIGAESSEYDAEIYRVLLEILLGIPVVRYPTRLKFSGWPSVLTLSESYLRDADDDGVRHALFAIDNDGGTKEHLEHDRAHVAADEAASKTGCRACLLTEALPAWWTANARKRCVAVPVQTLETWLLSVRGDAFTAPSPEQQYYADVLKKRFFGRPLPPSRHRLVLALAEIRKPDALTILRQRRSFQHFEAQLSDWP